MEKKDKTYLSIVVPFYNEKDVVRDFHNELIKAIRDLKKPCEVIYINDGSSDNMNEILMELVNKCSIPITILEFKRNYGQTAGLQAGFDYAAGEIIIAMDGDLQHDPSEIPMFLEKIEEGFDLVSGWRKKRVDNFWIRRFPSLIANKIMAKLSGIELHDFGTTYKAYRKEVVDNIKLYGELHRFIPVLISRNGAKTCEVPIKNIVRQNGESKYGLSRTFRVLCDILTLIFLVNYSARPMHFLGMGGLISLFTGGTLLFFSIVIYFIWHVDLRGTMQIATMSIILGVQLFATGLISEILSRIHYETTGKKIYNINNVYKNIN